MNWKMITILCTAFVSLNCVGGFAVTALARNLSINADHVAKSADKLNWVRYTDSAEGAFSMDVPVG